jgi:hypothetical protein
MMANAQVKAWYGSSQWKKKRAEQLRLHPRCFFCLLAGMETRATTADHRIPHRGDHDLFWYGDLDSLCSTHHSSSKQRQERRGHGGGTGLDGWAAG